MKYGAQIYTLRNELKTVENVKTVFEFLQSQKCSIVELAAMPPISAKELKKLSIDTGIEICSTHSSFDDIKNNIDRLADEHLEHGTKIIGIGSMPGEYRDGVDGAKRFMDIFNEAGAKIADRGMKMCYHNHSFEFKKIGDTCIEDVLLLNSSENVTFCLDVYWAKVGGVDIANYIKRIGTKLACLHLKDYKKVCFFWHTMCAPGDGILDMKEYIKLAENFGCKYGLIEVDGGSTPPRESIERGMKYLLENC